MFATADIADGKYLTAHDSRPAWVEPAQRITWEAESPNWMPAAVASLKRLSFLQTGWDSFGARRIDGQCIRAAIAVLRSICLETTPRPSVVPASGGGVQLEWHIHEVDLEVEFLPSTKVLGEFEDMRTGETWSEDLSSDMRLLAAAVKRISPPA